MGCETEHFEKQPLFFRSPSAILPRISEDGVVIFLLFRFISFFLKHSRVSVHSFVKIRVAEFNATKRLLRIKRDCGRFF